MQASLAQQLLQQRPTCDCQAMQMPCKSLGRRTVAFSRGFTAGKKYRPNPENDALCHSSIAAMRAWHCERPPGT